MKPSTKHDGAEETQGSGWFPPGFPSFAALGWPERLAVGFALAHIVCESGIALSQGFLALAVISIGVAIRKRRLVLEPDPLYVPLLLFAAGSSLSAVFAPHPLASIRETGDWFNFLTLPVMLILLRQIRGFARAATVAFGALLVVDASWGLVQFLTLGQRDLEHRITGPAPHVMTYSGILLPLCVVAVVFFLERRRAWVGAIALTGCVALVATLTRSAWIGWMAGLAAWVVMRRSRALLWLAPVTVILLIVAPLSIFGRMISTFDLRQYSNLDRIRMVEAGAEIIRDYPVFGVGPGNIPEVYVRYRRADAPRFFVPHLHNNVVQIWAERGVLPLAGFLLFFAMVGARCTRIARNEESAPWGRAGMAAAVSIFVAGLFEFNFGDSEVLMTLLTLLALLLSTGEGGIAGDGMRTNGTATGVVPTG